MLKRSYKFNYTTPSFGASSIVVLSANDNGNDDGASTADDAFLTSSGDSGSSSSGDEHKGSMNQSGSMQSFSTTPSDNSGGKANSGSPANPKYGKKRKRKSTSKSSMLTNPSGDTVKDLITHNNMLRAEVYRLETDNKRITNQLGSKSREVRLLKKVEGSSAITPKVLIDHDFHRETAKHTLGERICSYYPMHQYCGVHGNAYQARYESIYFSPFYYDDKNVQDLIFR